MAWNFSENSPVWLQIKTRIRNKIISGEYGPDEQIPTVRQLAVTAAVNPNTVQRALVMLEEDGLIYSNGTIGRFVTSDEEVLRAARTAAVKELVQDFVKKAEYISATREELIAMLKEEFTDERFTG